MTILDPTTGLETRTAESTLGSHWYYGWNILVVVFIFQAIIFGLTFYCFTFWISEWTGDFNANRSDVLLIMLALQVLNGICAPFAGRALDRYDIRTLVITGIFCYAGGMALVGMSNSLPMIGLIYASLIMIGTLWAGPFSAQFIITKWFIAKRGMALGIGAAGTSFGGFVLPPFVSWLIYHYGWRDTHLILAALIVLLLIPLVLLILRNRPRDVGLSDLGDAATAQAVVTSAKLGADERNWSVGEVLRERSFWITAIGLLPVIVAFGGFSQNLAPLAADFGIDTPKTALLISTMALSMLVGKLLLGMSGDHVDHRWLILAAQFTALAGLGLLTLPAPSYALMFLISGLIGFASGGILPLMGILISTRFGAVSFGLVVGLLNSALIFGAFAPWVAGLVRDYTGAYGMFWIMAAVFTLLTMPLVLTLPKPQTSGGSA